MPFPKALLAEHENIVLDLRPHWLSVIPSVLWTVVLGVVLFLGYAAMEAVFAEETATETAKSVVGGVVTLTWILVAVIPVLRWYMTMFVVTTDRLITRRGIIVKHSKEIPLERINDVAFSQTVIERFLGAGDLLVESAGERGQTRIDNVRKPEQVQLVIYNWIEKNSDQGVAREMARPAGPTTSIPQQIDELAKLKDRGVLTAEEFEAKKRDLLDRL